MVENIENLKEGNYIFILNNGGSISSYDNNNISKDEVYKIIKINSKENGDVEALLNDNYCIRLHSSYKGSANYKSYYRLANQEEINKFNNIYQINNFSVFN